MKKTIHKVIYYLIMIIFLTIFSVFLAVFLDKALSGNTDFFFNGNFNIKNIIEAITTTEKAQQLFLVIDGMFLLLVFYLIIQQNAVKSNVSPTKEVAKGIRTPIAVGEGQYGTAKFMEIQDIDKIYDKVILDKNNVNIQKLLQQESASEVFENAGLVVGFNKKFGKEHINFLGDDIHSLTVGSTRSRKNKTDLYFKQQD